MGFLKNKKCCNKIVNYVGISDRITYIMTKISNEQNVKVIRIRASTESRKNEEIEELYNKIQDILNEN